MSVEKFKKIADMEGAIVYMDYPARAITIQDDGFERLVYYKAAGKKEWIHKDFRD